MLNGNMKRIAVLTPSGATSNWRKLEGVMEFARTCPDWEMQIVTSERVAEVRRALGRFRPDGIICALLDEKSMAYVATLDVPTVIAFHPGELAVRPEGARYVVSDSVQIGRTVARHVYARGYRSFLCVGKRGSPWEKERFDEFVKASMLGSAYADKLANPDITWETSQQLDLGFDARFFNSRLNMAFDWYQKDTKNWLVNAPIMGHFGANAPYINGGDVRNSGVELALNWNEVRTPDFSYNIGVNAAYNKNRVTRIANDEGIIHGGTNVVQGIAEMYRAQVGYPIGYFWTYKTDGVFQNQDEIDAWKAKGYGTIVDNVVPGDLKILDLHQDGIINDLDKTMTGDPNPDWNVGFNFSVFFKGFDLGMSAYGMFGHQVFRAYRRYTDSQTHKNRLARMDNMKAVFAVRRPEEFENKHILLVDDIITTGATTENCYHALRSVDNLKISVAALAVTSH